jgi:hypothetical protein
MSERRIVTVAPAATAVPPVTLADAYEHTGIVPTAALDVKLQRTLDAAISAAEAFCAAKFSTLDVTEKYTAKAGAIDVLLTHYPLLSVTEIDYGNGPVAVAPGDLEFSPLGIIYLAEPLAAARVTVKYLAGTALVPAAVVRAILQLTAEMHTTADHPANVASESIDGVGRTDYRSAADSTIQGAGGVRLPASVAAALAPYMQRAGLYV